MFFTTVSAFDATISKPIKGEKWARGQTSGAIIEWAPGATPVTLPSGFPASLDIWFVDSNKTQVSQVTTGNPSKYARWVFDPSNLVPTNLPDGDYYVQLVNSLDKADVAYSPNLITINGGTALNRTNSTSTNSTNTTSIKNETKTDDKSKPAAVRPISKDSSGAAVIAATVLGVTSFVLS